MVRMPDPIGTVRVEHTNATNAQAALQAAATVLSSGRGYSSIQVMELADEFLTWLDAKDNART